MYKTKVFIFHNYASSLVLATFSFSSLSLALCFTVFHESFGGFPHSSAMCLLHNLVLKQPNWLLFPFFPFSFFSLFLLKTICWKFGTKTSN